MGAMWSGIPGTQFLANAGNVLQGTDWMVQGFRSLLTTLSPTALAIGGVTVAVAGLTAGLSAGVKVAREMTSTVRDLSEMSAMSLIETTRLLGAVSLEWRPAPASSAGWRAPR